MNADYEKQLEASIRRELNSLGELEAPPDMAVRVMRVITRRDATPWYRCAWQTWPLAFRVVSFAGLTTAFGFLCFVSWWLVQFVAPTPPARQIFAWFNLADVAWKAVKTLVDAMGLAFWSLGPAVIIGAVLLLLVCYSACVGLGTIYFRLALAPVKERPS
jgi:hypothetical protein